MMAVLLHVCVYVCVCERERERERERRYIYIYNMCTEPLPSLQTRVMLCLSRDIYVDGWMDGWIG